MRVNIARSTPPSLPSPHNASSYSPSSSLFTSNKLHLRPSPSYTFISSTLNRSKSTDHISLRRSCSASFDGHDFPQHHPIEDFTRKQNTHKLNFPSFRRNSTSTTTSFGQSDSQVELLEPSLLGICPEPPDWPARDAMIRDCIALRESSIELPLSLRMIEMKQNFLRLEEERQIGVIDEHMKDNPIMNLCFSTFNIIREVQGQALKSRGMVLNEELDSGVLSKVQREMTSSFVWLFKEVFSKTPDLMLQVMVLTSDFATHSIESLQSSMKTQEKLMKVENLEQDSMNWGIGQLELELENLGVPKSGVLEESEVGLWNSMVEEANKIVQGGYNVKEQELGFVINHDHTKDHDHVKLGEKNTEFVAPVGIEIEGDDYEEYSRTDLLYQMGLFKEPNNTLLLSNYAQFLCLVSRDYDRAEVCFKRAIQLDSTDGEVMTQYANFLWAVREDLWAAEERFLQAMAAEPDNSYHASKYASFLWSTGGEETCYPLDPPSFKR